MSKIKLYKIMNNYYLQEIKHSRTLMKLCLQIKALMFYIKMVNLRIIHKVKIKFKLKFYLEKFKD